LPNDIILLTCNLQGASEDDELDVKFRSQCAIASALDLVGDKWSLVVIRSLMLGASSYSDLLTAPEKIATNILADRLERLEASGLIVSEAAPSGGKARRIYRLTRAGAELLTTLQAIAAWGEAHIPGRWRVPGWFMSAKPNDFLNVKTPSAHPEAAARMWNLGRKRMRATDPSKRGGS
jgi:DNA-binding HxlR family transcriptional regulator